MSIQKRSLNGRLVFYHERADSSFWDSQWLDRIRPGLYSKPDRGFLGVFEKPFVKYLPTQGRIIEAGCGLAKTVVALRSRGYDCEGIDYARNTIDAVKKIKPDLPIRVGDVLNMDVEDGYYDGYISLGVIEHREEGPEPYIKEAYRVLSPGAVAYISVPYMNLIRKLKNSVGFYSHDVGDLEFYAYAFSVKEIKSLIEANGFDVIDLHGYASWKGIKDEILPVLWIDRIPKVRGLYRRITARMPLCDRYFGHMIGFVCKKR